MRQEAMGSSSERHDYIWTKRIAVEMGKHRSWTGIISKVDYML
jgi:hypothetical protein